MRVPSSPGHTATRPSLRLRAACIVVLALRFWAAQPETAAILGSRVSFFPPVSREAAAVERSEGAAVVDRYQHAPPLSVCRRALRLRGGAREGSAATRPDQHDSDSLSSALVQVRRSAAHTEQTHMCTAVLGLPVAMVGDASGA